MPSSRPQGRTQRPLELPGRMAATDALFWYAEAALPEFRPIIAGLYQLDRAPDPNGIEAATDAALALVPRLRQRVVEAPFELALPQWVEDEHFDRAYHPCGRTPRCRAAPCGGRTSTSTGPTTCGTSRCRRRAASGSSSISWRRSSQRPSTASGRCGSRTGSMASREGAAPTS